jgi:hypothetical protein
VGLAHPAVGEGFDVEDGEGFAGRLRGSAARRSMMAPVASVERSSMAMMATGMVCARRERRVASMLAASLRAGTMTVI